MSLYKTAVGHSKLTISLSEVVTNFCRISKDIQSAFVNAGVAPHIIDAVINNVRITWVFTHTYTLQHIIAHDILVYILHHL